MTLEHCHGRRYEENSHQILLFFQYSYPLPNDDTYAAEQLGNLVTLTFDLWLHDL